MTMRHYSQHLYMLIIHHRGQCILGVCSKMKLGYIRLLFCHDEHQTVLALESDSRLVIHWLTVMLRCVLPRGNKVSWGSIK